MIIPVSTDTKNYDIIIDSDILKDINRFIDLDRKIMIITDTGVPCQYSNTVLSQCPNGYIYTIPQGENSKNFNEYQKILSKMLSLGFGRNDAVIAVGGGVVGDLGGFVASTYMRGIDFYNIPTTLLSQVDSSVGGKTAVDFDGVKNIAGTFYQPSKVIIDISVLKTLDNRQIASGLAEVIKMSATSDSSLFELIENSTNLFSDLPKIIPSALKIKKNVVEKDTKEQGLRRVLNFGHTIGHAIESYNEGKLLHGECVALGMIPFSNRMARERIKNILKKYSLPVQFDKNWNLLPYIAHDKKKTSSKITSVFVNKIGEFYFDDLTPEEIIKLAEELV